MYFLVRSVSIADCVVYKIGRKNRLECPTEFLQHLYLMDWPKELIGVSNGMLIC